MTFAFLALLPTFLLAAPSSAWAYTFTPDSGWSDRCSKDLEALSERRITPEELKPLSFIHLAMLRNALHARRGQKSEDPFWAGFFQDCPWYRPADGDAEAALSEVERENVSLLRETEVRKTFEAEAAASTTTAIPVRLEDPDPHSEVSFRCDMDGDRKLDLVVVHREEGPRHILSVNGRLALGWGDWLSVADLAAADRLRELALFDSSDEEASTAFFRYDGRRLQPMGEVEGDPLGILSFDEEANRGNIPGDGTVTGRSMGSIVHRWSHPRKWRVREDGRLAPLREDYYPMGTLVTLRLTLPLYAGPSAGSGSVFRLKRGEKAEIVKCDDLRWCMIRDMRGREGWFQVMTDGFDIEVGGEPAAAEEVFSGLSPVE